MKITTKKKKQTYWYLTEIHSCVLCGRETRYRERVYTKPKPEEKTKWFDDACSEHFI